MVHEAIQKIYDDFKKTFESNKYQSVRAALDKVSEKNKYNHKFKHSLGEFAIFYSLPTLKPDVVIIGNNPSWFHKSDPKKAQENLYDLAGCIPEQNVNSYRDRGHTFGDQFCSILAAINKEEWLDSLVGLNRFWVQTGSGGIEEVKEQSDKIEKGVFRELEKQCEERTRKLVQILSPKMVILFGGPAQRTFGPIHRKTLPHIKFCDSRHPARGGREQAIADIKNFLSAEDDKVTRN